jgi:glycosidase
MMGVVAQTRDKQIRSRVDSALTARYFKSTYDTNFVARPEGKLTLKVRMNQTGNSFHAKGTVNDIYSKADLSTSHKTTFSIAAIYRGIGIGMAVNPYKWSGVYKDYEFNLNYYSSRLSLDFSYQRSESLSGDIRRDDNLSQMQSGDVTLKVANIAGYYIFNHRRFSFPAAFTQSYIQRRSAGSWLAGFCYQGGSIKTTDDAPDELGNARIYVGNFAIGGGYGYNLVAKKWLFHLSAQPNVIIFNSNSVKMNG